MGKLANSIIGEQFDDGYIEAQIERICVDARACTCASVCKSDCTPWWHQPFGSLPPPNDGGHGIG